MNQYYIDNPIINYLLLNYKTNILYFLCSLYFCNYNCLLAIICFLFGYFACYIGHQMMHVDLLYINITSIAHSYHHDNPNLFGNILNAIIEYLGLMGNIVIKYISAQFGINYFFINEWLILFLYFIYTTVHNYNYGYLKVNNYHTKHHHDYRTNIGPDIFDYLFNSKNKETMEMECVDHYIPNIICSFIIVYCLKNVHENINKDIIPQIFTYSFSILLFISIIGCIYAYIDQLDSIMKKEWIKFSNKTNKNTNT